MREIKFRIMDKSSKKFEIFPILYSEGAACDLNFCDTDTVGMFTGLKDKNGKEIYEGDIVQVVNCGCGKEICKSFHPRVSEVKWLKTYLFPFGDQMQGDTYQDPRNYQVIGNIYENKELLK